MKPIIVAVDGSPESAAALRWAVEHARLVGATVRAVTAYELPPTALDPLGGYWQLHRMAEEAARSRAHTVIEKVVGPAGIDHLVTHGTIDDVLCCAAGQASMVVLGTRSTDGWRDRIRSSLTNRITGRITCPVVSIPATRVPVAA